MPSPSTSGPHHASRTSWASAASAGTDSGGSAASATSSSGVSCRLSSRSAPAAEDKRPRGFTPMDPMRPPPSDLERLGFQELLQAKAAELATEARLLVTAEGRHEVDPPAVDVDLAGAHPPGDGLGPLDVARPD